MKYYVAEETYDAQTGELLTQERVTGDTEDIVWAHKQLEFLANEKLAKERKFIESGTISVSKTECSFVNKKTKIRFVACIKELKEE